jgi:hypothetical protein
MTVGSAIYDGRHTTFRYLLLCRKAILDIYNIFPASLRGVASSKNAFADDEARQWAPTLDPVARESNNVGSSLSPESLISLRTLIEVSEKRAAKKYITFICREPTSDIDFIRRFGECCTCWVVGDIGAALDLRRSEKLARGSDISGLSEPVSSSPSSRSALQGHDFCCGP